MYYDVKSLKQLRKEKGLTAQYVASYCNVTDDYFRKVETGFYKISCKMATRLAELYDETIDYIVVSQTKVREKRINKR